MKKKASLLACAPKAANEKGFKRTCNETMKDNMDKSSLTSTVQLVLTAGTDTNVNVVDCEDTNLL